MKLKIQLHYPEMPAPKKAHATDAGIDLTCMTIVIKTKDVFFFDCGISVEPPPGYYTQLVPRSSIYKQDFIMANSVGIIDQDYRGKIFMPMRYVGTGDGKKAAMALVGHRVGQLILKKVEDYQIEIVDSLSDTIRGEGGFGSSGSK
ncbi:MAG: dUTP diphosphatase [SAR324 cluster bacterium]|nr:dUTP diphosphatase [SAR324 cluster bacterium]